MQSSDGNIWALLASWFPMLLLIGVWIFFMKRMRIQFNPADSPALAEQKRHNEALEKILANHEDRLRRLEMDKG